MVRCEQRPPQRAARPTGRLFAAARARSVPRCAESKAATSVGLERDPPLGARPLQADRPLAQGGCGANSRSSGRELADGRPGHALRQARLARTEVSVPGAEGVWQVALNERPAAAAGECPQRPRGTLGFKPAEKR